MASRAIPGVGTFLKLGNGWSGGSPEVFTTVAEVRDLAGPAMTSTIIDVTNQSSPAGYKEKLLVLRDGGQLRFPVNYILDDPSQNADTGLQAVYNAGVRANFQLVFPNPRHDTAHFTAFVMTIDPKSPVEKEMTADITLEVTGPVSWTHS